MSARRAQRSLYLAISAASLGLVLLTWFVVTDLTRQVSPVVLPSPGDVLSQAVWLLGHRFQGATLLGHTVASVSIVVAAWLIAVAIGIPFGILMGWFRPLERVAGPLFELLRPIPPIAWIPFSIVWFGIEAPARIFVVFLAAFSPCVLNAYEAVRSVDPQQVRAARTLGAGEARILGEIVVPWALPLLFTGAQIALGNAWMTMVVAELLAARAGLGYIMQIARLTLQADIIVVAMIVIGLLGAIFAIALRLLAAAMMPWIPSDAR